MKRTEMMMMVFGRKEKKRPREDVLSAKRAFRCTNMVWWQAKNMRGKSCIQSSTLLANDDDAK